LVLETYSLSLLLILLNLWLDKYIQPTMKKKSTVSIQGVSYLYWS